MKNIYLNSLIFWLPIYALLLLGMAKFSNTINFSNNVLNITLYSLLIILGICTIIGLIFVMNLPHIFMDKLWHKGIFVKIGIYSGLMVVFLSIYFFIPKLSSSPHLTLTDKEKSCYNFYSLETGSDIVCLIKENSDKKSFTRNWYAYKGEKGYYVNLPSLYRRTPSQWSYYPFNSGETTKMLKALKITL